MGNKAIDKDYLIHQLHAFESQVIDKKIDTKVDKVQGKGLSTEDYTTAEKTKLGGLADIKSIGSGLSLNASTGELSASGTSITIDSAMNNTSTNPVQNKVITSALGNKVDKVQGKGLSTEDYTTAEKTKLSGIATGAQVNTIESITMNGTLVAPDANKNVALTAASASDVSAIQAVIPSTATSSNKLATAADIPNVSNFISKSSTAGLVKNDGTIDTTSYATTTSVNSALSGKQNTISDLSTIRSGAAAGATALQPSSTAGLIKNDGTIDTNTYLVAANISNKADKVNSAINGNLAGLNASGNLTDSNIKATDVIKKSSTSGLLKNDGTVDTNTYLTSTTIAGATDSAITSPANKQVLEYNSTTSKWENKAKFTALIGELEAGETELAFTNASITSTARFDVYTEDCYIPLVDIVRNGTTLTLTFPEQEDDVNVKVLIYED